ncbi:MAG: hypothetical protein HGGPFJEG_03060 [Ignavibacteria bacterium]|nr:hypothetical protein [Ignavibacteria bacterium]
MTFFQEWRKLIICIVLFMLLFGLQYFTDYDFSGTLKTLIDFALTLLGVSALRYSVLSTSERNALRNDLPKKPDEGYPDPMVRHPLDQ